MARAGAAERFWAEFRALYEAAGEPTLERLVRLGREQSPKIDISDSTIDDWLNGISVPAKHLRYFDVLVAFLQPMAKRRSGYSPQSAGWWQGLLRAAREERAAARGAGRPRAGGRQSGGSPGGAEALARNEWQSAVLLGPAGELPRVADIGLLELGVHRSISAVESVACQDQADEMPGYVPRDRDADIEAAVKRGGLVVVTGRSAAGKSRAAAEAMRRAAGGRHLLVPRDGTAVRALAESGQPLRDAVIWLDDLEQYVKDPGLDSHALNRLCPQGRTDITVLATLRPDAAGAPPTPVMSSSDPAKVLARLLEMATTIRLPFETSGTERERAMRYEQDQRIARWLADDSGAGLPEYLAAGPAAVRRWMHGRDGEHLIGAALISAAVDCAGHTTTSRYRARCSLSCTGTISTRVTRTGRDSPISLTASGGLPSRSMVPARASPSTLIAITGRLTISLIMLSVIPAPRRFRSTRGASSFVMPTRTRLPRS